MPGGYTAPDIWGIRAEGAAAPASGGAHRHD